MATATYYFNHRSSTNAWQYDPNKMVDGDLGTFASTNLTSDIELCDENTCDGTDLGTITKVEARAYIKVTGILASTIQFIPYFGGASDGDTEVMSPVFAEAWAGYYDITSDTNAPGSWAWTDVRDLDYKLIAQIASGTVFVAKVEIQVTYTTPVVASGAGGFRTKRNIILGG